MTFHGDDCHVCGAKCKMLFDAYRGVVSCWVCGFDVPAIWSDLGMRFINSCEEDVNPNTTYHLLNHTNADVLFSDRISANPYSPGRNRWWFLRNRTAEEVLKW